MRPIDADALRNYWLYNGRNERVYDTNDFLDSIDEEPTLDFTTANWISVEDALPVMQTVSEKRFIVCYGKKVTYLLYERTILRGKTVYRWKYPWGRVYDGPKITHWMPLPEPPENTERS